MSKRLTFVAALLMLPMLAAAQPRQGDFEITLGGGGSNNKSFNAGGFNVNASFGYFVTKNVEVSLRQAITYADFNNGTNWTGATRGAVDFHFDLGVFQPFVGGNIGYIYGDGINDTWEAAPEAGIKFYVTESKRTFLFAMVEYEFFFRHGGDVGSGFDKGQFVYTLGIGFNLP